MAENMRSVGGAPEISWGKPAMDPFLMPSKLHTMPSPLFMKPSAMPNLHPALSAPPPQLTSSVARMHGLLPAGAPPTSKAGFFPLVFGLMLLGVCFFLSGFFLGMWLKSPAPSSPSGSKRSTAKTTIDKRTGAPVEKASAATPSNAPHASPSAKKGSATSAKGPSKGKEGSKSEAHKSRYTIQLGAFVTRANAADLVDNLKDMNIFANISEQRDPSGTPLFCVHSGAFSTYVEAETMARSLCDKDSLSAVVVRAPHPNPTKNS